MHGEGGGGGGGGGRGGGGGLVNHCIGRDASHTKTPLLGDIVTLKGGEPRSVNYRHANSGLYTYVVVN